MEVISKVDSRSNMAKLLLWVIQTKATSRAILFMRENWPRFRARRDFGEQKVLADSSLSFGVYISPCKF